MCCPNFIGARLLAAEVIGFSKIWGGMYIQTSQPVRGVYPPCGEIPGRSFFRPCDLVNLVARLYEFCYALDSGICSSEEPKGRVRPRTELRNTSRSMHQIANLKRFLYTETCGNNRYSFARLFTTICSQEANSLPIQ